MVKICDGKCKTSQIMAVVVGTYNPEGQIVPLSEREWCGEKDCIQGVLTEIRKDLEVASEKMKNAKEAGPDGSE